MSLPIFRFYRQVISPTIHTLMPGLGCRFYPSCSVYAEVAIHNFPWPRAAFLIGRRLLKCHPFSDGGVDPVPLPLDRLTGKKKRGNRGSHG